MRRVPIRGSTYRAKATAAAAITTTVVAAPRPVDGLTPEGCHMPSEFSARRYE